MAAAVGGVDVPICAANVGGGLVAEGAGHAVNRGRAAFEFEEGADGCFIQVQVEAAEAKTGAVFLVAEGGLKAQRRERGAPIARIMTDDYFPFGAFFEARFRFGTARRRCFGSKHDAVDTVRADAMAFWRCRFGADAEESAAASQVGVRRVVERVGFEDAALGCGAQGLDGEDRGAEVGYTELDFDFAVRFSRLGHGEV